MLMVRPRLRTKQEAVDAIGRHRVRLGKNWKLAVEKLAQLFLGVLERLASLFRFGRTAH